MFFLHLGKCSNQKVQLGKIYQVQFLRLGKNYGGSKIDLVKFRCRILGLAEIFQVRKNRTCGGARPGPVLRRRTGYGSWAEIRPLRRRTGYGSRVDIRQGGSACQLALAIGYSQFELWRLFGADPGSPWGDPGSTWGELDFQNSQIKNPKRPKFPKSHQPCGWLV